MKITLKVRWFKQIYTERSSCAFNLFFYTEGSSCVFIDYLDYKIDILASKIPLPLSLLLVPRKIFKKLRGLSHLSAY
jgi:hypothetical protein